MTATTGSLIQLYFSRKGSEVFMLKAAMTEAGFWLVQPPATSLHQIEKISLADHLNLALTSPTPQIPTPARDSFPCPSSLGLSYRSWHSLHKKFDSVSIASHAGSYTITKYHADGLADETHGYSGANAFATVVDYIATRIETLAYPH